MASEYWIERRGAFEEIHRTLIKAQERRHELRGFIGNDPEWVTYERDEMFRIVNVIRARYDLRPVLMSDVRRAEDLAYGHVDYTEKFALGCADVATDTTTTYPTGRVESEGVG